MKTKEEILIQKVGKKYYDNNAITTDEALESMQEYADQEKESEAVAFAEFLQNYYTTYGQNDDWWRNNINYPTEEIYKIFKLQK